MHQSQRKSSISHPRSQNAFFFLPPHNGIVSISSINPGQTSNHHHSSHHKLGKCTYTIMARCDISNWLEKIRKSDNAKREG
jgi:hypothetical protein